MESVQTTLDTIIGVSSYPFTGTWENESQRNMLNIKSKKL